MSSPSATTGHVAQFRLFCLRPHAPHGHIWAIGRPRAMLSHNGVAGRAAVVAEELLRDGLPCDHDSFIVTCDQSIRGRGCCEILEVII